ncbi:ferrochelatase [Dysgonomonas macrotermitis]|uniref:Ferrochelatase n=1 Tax=Dysgonomonas macrotermitis TaxID=1346286 RepID=A0A1M4ZWE7_9BACT|nr:ferrochelatase [Dysgonomonas macrotermitis]SHF21936.1 ferrochelatase [Dysgonomonas macrotermitis]
MRGILILNTGSPKTKNREDVKFFIGAMLSDPLVMSTVPNWFRDILAKRIIAPLRASNSASHYELIWDNEHNESPLIYNSLELAKKIQAATGMPTEIAMRYGNPSVPDAFARLQKKCATLHEVIVVPMFPQYAQSSYQTAVDEVGRCFLIKPHSFRIKFVEPYYNKPGYISSLAQSIKPFIEKGYDKLVFSFHSLPIAHVEIGWNKGKEFDYVYQVKETVRLVTKELGIDPKKNRIVYSSAIGSKWLKPDLEETMKQLAQSGTERVIALTAGFPADNLESLYDIDIVAREAFESNGGKEFHFVPGLNAEDFWVQELIKIIAGKV